MRPKRLCHALTGGRILIPYDPEALAALRAEPDVLPSTRVT